MRRSFPARRRGFTLIEVVVALAVFGLAGVVLAGAFVNVLNAQQAALRRNDRAADLRLVRAAFRAQTDPKALEAWVDLPLPDGRKARWRATLAPTTVSDLFDATLEIEFTEADGTRVAPLTETWRLLRPTWSQPADREALRAKAREKLSQRSFQ